MGSKRAGKLAVFAVLSVVFTSCYKLLETDFPDYEPSLVLNAMLRPGDALRVHVSRSANLGDSAVLPVNDAVVRINDTVLPPVGDGWYASSDSVRAGRTYVCTVEASGFPAITRSATVPYAPEIVSLSALPELSVSASGEMNRRYNLTFRNDTSRQCYYHFVLADYVEDYRPATGPASSMSVSEAVIDPNSNVVFRNEQEPLSVFSNVYMDSDVFTLQWSVPTQMRSLADTVFVNCSARLELQSVSAEYYRHLKRAAAGYYDKNGIFAAYASTCYVHGEQK